MKENEPRAPARLHYVTFEIVNERRGWGPREKQARMRAKEHKEMP